MDENENKNQGNNRSIFHGLADGMRSIGLEQFYDEALLISKSTMGISGSDMYAFQAIEYMQESGVESFEEMAEVIQKAIFLIMSKRFMPELSAEIFISFLVDSGDKFDHADRLLMFLKGDLKLSAEKIYHVIANCLFWVTLIDGSIEFIGYIQGAPLTEEEMIDKFHSDMMKADPEMAAQEGIRDMILQFMEAMRSGEIEQEAISVESYDEEDDLVRKSFQQSALLKWLQRFRSYFNLPEPNEDEIATMIADLDLGIEDKDEDE